MCRDHCKLGETYNHTLYPHLRGICQQSIFFLHYTIDSTLTFIDEIACFISINKIFCHCYKKMGRGGEVMIRVPPIIQCCMVCVYLADIFAKLIELF